MLVGAGLESAVAQGIEFFGGGTITSPKPISTGMLILARSKRATRLTRSWAIRAMRPQFEE